MSDFSRSWMFQYDDKRCADCGLIWAIESGVNTWKCPRCARREESKESEEKSKLLRQINSLKGVITRMKKPKPMEEKIRWVFDN